MQQFLKAICITLFMEFLFFSVRDIGPEFSPGHTEAYDVMCPPPSIELDEVEVEVEEADSMELETSSAREAFFARLNLLTTEEGTRIEEVLFWIHAAMQ